MIAEFEEPDPFVRGDINEFEHNDDTKPEGSDSPYNDYETAVRIVNRHDLLQTFSAVYPQFLLLY